MRDAGGARTLLGAAPNATAAQRSNLVAPACATIALLNGGFELDNNVLSGWTVVSADSSPSHAMKGAPSGCCFLSGLSYVLMSC